MKEYSFVLQPSLSSATQRHPFTSNRSTLSHPRLSSHSHPQTPTRSHTLICTLSHAHSLPPFLLCLLYFALSLSLPPSLSLSIQFASTVLTSTFFWDEPVKVSVRERERKRMGRILTFFLGQLESGRGRQNLRRFGRKRERE